MVGGNFFVAGFHKEMNVWETPRPYSDLYPFDLSHSLIYSIYTFDLGSDRIVNIGTLLQVFGAPLLTSKSVLLLHQI